MVTGESRWEHPGEGALVGSYVGEEGEEEGEEGEEGEEEDGNDRPRSRQRVDAPNHSDGDSD